MIRIVGCIVRLCRLRLAFRGFARAHLPVVLPRIEDQMQPRHHLFDRGQLAGRSGLAARSGVTVLNAPGTVDSDYRGEVAVLLVNLSDVAVAIAPLERIAQLVIAPVAHAELVVSAVGLDATARGVGGYGSTGST